MPELPEVETICEELRQTIQQQTINQTLILDKKLREPISPELTRVVTGQKVTDISRRGKYILLHLSNNTTIIIHLGMTGRLSYLNDFNKQKHLHLVFNLSNNHWLTYSDPRRFGLITFCKTNELPMNKFIKHLAVEPLGRDFNLKYLENQCRRRRVSIKCLLMKNDVVVGIGNIYANEILYRAGISPLRLANSLKQKEILALIIASKLVLRQAIRARGTTFSNYVDIQGKSGNFQQKLKVYLKKGLICKRCSSIITKITQNSRSTFYCPYCQK